MFSNKKAVETIIATVLVIGITLAAFSSIYVYVFPFIKEEIQKSQKCGEAQIVIDSAKGFTCYDSSTQQLQVMVNRGPNEFDIGGIGVSVRDEGVSKRYDVLESPNPYVRLANSEYGGFYNPA